MPYAVLFQLVVFIFIGANIVLLSWLFPVEHSAQKKTKSKKA